MEGYCVNTMHLSIDLVSFIRKCWNKFSPEIVWTAASFHSLCVHTLASYLELGSVFKGKPFDI